MSGPSRRRNPIITRGKKSDKKKKKMGAQNRDITTPKDSFTELREGLDSQRKELIRGNSPLGDKAILSEPSPLFFDKTENIRSKKKGGHGAAILLEEPGYKDGVDVSKVKQERMLVVHGKRPSIFQDLPRQFKELEENLKQQVKESQTEVLERGRKREEQNKKNAAEESEKRRVEKEKLEAQRREEIEAKKREEVLRLEEVARLQAVELEKRQEAVRLAKSQAIEQERLESERKEKIEAKKREEVLRLEEVARLQAVELEERQEAVRLAKSQAIEQERLDSERKEKIEAEERKELLQLEEVAKLNEIEAERLAESRSAVLSKQGFLRRLWMKIKNAFLSNVSEQKHQLQEEVSIVEEPVQQIVEIEEPVQHIVEIEEPEEEVEIETVVEKIEAQEEILVVEEPVQQIVEIEEPVQHIVEVEEPEEILVVEEPVQQIVEIEEPVQHIVEIEEPEEELSIEEPVEEVEIETLVEEIETVQEIEAQEEVVVVEEPVQQIVEIEEPVQHIVEVEEPEEILVVEEPVQHIVEIEEPEEELAIEEPIEEVEIEGPEEILVVEEPEEVIEELPDFETGEVLLADLRMTMRDEALPIEFILKVLMEKHGLSKKDVNILIDHIASPFSICKTMKGDSFERFIESFDDQNSQSSGVEIWTQIIQIIGLDSLSADQQVEIYNLFMGDAKKVNQKVRTLAILYHFIPLKFERWWQKEMIDSFTTKKYNSDFSYYQGKNFSEQIVEEARMLICAYAIEKPGLVAKAYTSAKHQAGKYHENRTERWLKKVAGKIEYLTEDEIQNFAGQKYGNKHVSTKITPDILLKKPIKLSQEGQHIHWIDAKKHFIDPALSPEYRVDSFCNQLEKYVRAYGPGLIVWGKDFSEEWNDATKGVVQHIKI